jgi:hypothetical protein
MWCQVYDLSLLTPDFDSKGRLRTKRACLECPRGYFTPDGLFCHKLPKEWVIKSNLISCGLGYNHVDGNCVQNVIPSDLKNYSIENAKRIIYNFFNSQYNLEESVLEDSPYIAGWFN